MTVREILIWDLEEAMEWYDYDVRCECQIQYLCAVSTRAHYCIEGDIATSLDSGGSLLPI